MRAAPLAALALVAAGCGASTSSQPAPHARQTARTAFVQACGSCHTLAAAGTHGTVGKSLDDVRPSAADVRGVIARGKGSMPAGLLDPAQARLVARWVARAAGT